MFGHIALVVGLDQKVEVPLGFIGGNRGVQAHDFLVVDGGADQDVLANGQPQAVGQLGQAEAVDARVVGQAGLLDQRELLELIGLEHGLAVLLRLLEEVERHERANDGGNRGKHNQRVGLVRHPFRSCLLE